MEQEYDICWDFEAGKQLKDIYDHIKKNASENSARKIRNTIIDRIDELRKQPERFPPEPLLSHRKENFRFILVKPYKIIYEFVNQEVRILFIYSTRQNPNKILDHFK